MTSHDQLSKSLIQTFFPEFLALAAPVPAGSPGSAAPARRAGAGELGHNLQLTGRDAAEFEKLQTLALNQEIRAMQMTWAERMEKEYTEKGRQEGVHNLRKVVLRLLDQRFGSVPAKVQKKVEKISSMDRLTELAEKVLVVQSIDEMGLK